MKNKKTEYDERQITEQGKAFKWGFYLMLLLLVIGFTILEVFRLDIMEYNTMFSIFIWPPYAVCVIIQIVKDAYTSANDNDLAMVMCIFVTITGVLGICLTGFVLFTYADGVPIILNGKLNIGGLVTGICLSAVGIVNWIHILLQRKKPVED